VKRHAATAIAVSIGANDPVCDIGWIEMPQRSGLVP
jgi:hypothetical protein